MAPGKAPIWHVVGDAANQGRFMANEYERDNDNGSNGFMMGLLVAW